MDFEIRLPEAMPSNAFLVFFVPWWFIFCHIRDSIPFAGKDA